MTRTFDAFNKDVTTNQGYLYTTNARLSSFLANQRLTDAALAAANFQNKKILDVGCGDGAYSFALYDQGKPAQLTGIDPAAEAIKVAQQKIGDRKIVFEVQSAEALPYAKDSFDLVHIRGVLHHMDKPFEAVREALRVSPQIIIIEPNGFNPVLKVLEKLSSYHRAHGEKSYAPTTLDRWVNQLGAKVVRRKYVGLVPFFCPDFMARILKFIEPVVERTPILRSLVCAVYVIVAERK